jgi:hypothetical protein
MGAEDLRIAERGRGREMILERDFPLHIPSRTTTIGVPDYARTRPRCQRRARHGVFRK